MNLPILSVIIPIYNVEQFIQRCARSLFEQTANKRYIIEYIFVNDCTPDDSEAMLLETIKQYPKFVDRIKLIKHNKNMGLFLARRTGLMNANGKYIIHIDSDDWLESNMLESMLTKILEENADMCYCGAYHDYIDGTTRVNYIPNVDKGDDYIQIMIRFPHLWNVWTKMFRLSIAKKADCDLGDEIVTSGEDLRRNVANLLYCNKVTGLENNLYHYCENKNSITKSSKDYLPDMVANGDFLEEKLPYKYKEAILTYKRETLFYAITKNSEYVRSNATMLWSEAYNNLLLDKKLRLTQKLFLLLASKSFKIAQLFWFFSFSIYSRIKKFTH